MTAAITDLKNRLSYYLRRVARGESITVRGNPVARITPVGSHGAELEGLAAAGLARLPVEPLPKGFWTRSLPKLNKSLRAYLAEDREDRF